MFVYSYSIKIHVSGFGYLLESIFCILLVVKAFSLQKILRCLKKWWLVKRSGEYGRWAEPCSPISSTFETLVVHVQLSVVVKQNWSLSVDQCWLQMFHFWVHPIVLLSILLRCDGFTEVQKAVVGQTRSRSTNSDHDHFGGKFGFGKCFGAASWSSPWAGHCWLFYTIHLVSHHIQLRNGLLLHTREDNTSEWRFFLIAVSLWGTHLLSF